VHEVPLERVTYKGILAAFFVFFFFFFFFGLKREKIKRKRRKRNWEEIW
jgi:hypothetical protein